MVASPREDVVNEVTYDVRCSSCGRKLGEKNGKIWTFSVRGRLIVAERVLGIRCEQCGEQYVMLEDQS